MISGQDQPAFHHNNRDGDQCNNHHEHDVFDLQSLKKIANSGREENPDIFDHLIILQNIWKAQK